MRGFSYLKLFSDLSMEKSRIDLEQRLGKAEPVKQQPSQLLLTVDF